MDIKGKKIGIALTGSFCTFEKMFTELQNLKEAGADIYPIMSDASQPIGPKAYLDALAILPCTGNTAAKLANGITDTPVLMAAKAHMRNNKPLVISISTNDGLGMNLKNIGLLCNSKNIYFVPFGQDNYKTKPNSLVAHVELLLPTLEMALEHKQYQPILKDYLD